MRAVVPALRPIGIASFVALAGLATLAAPALVAEAPPAVALGRVTDHRLALGVTTGFLGVDLKLAGERLDAYRAARVLLKDARDDSGRSLLPGKKREPGFEDLPGSDPSIRVSLENPPRRARSFSLSGSVQLFEPGRDPGAVVTVEKALARLGKKLSSRGLKKAKIVVTPLSKTRYLEELKKQRPDEKKLAQIREEAKEEGMSNEQVDAVLELAKAFEGIGGEVPEGAVLLAGKAADFERIHSVKILGRDGKELPVRFSSGGSDGTTATRRYDLDAPPGPEASLVFTILTEEARVLVPFEFLEVPLP